MLRLQSALGIFALLLIAFALAENRRAVSLRQAAIGLIATFVTAAVLLKVPVVARAFGALLHGSAGWCRWLDRVEGRLLF